MMEEAQNSLLAAIENGRTDIVCSLISACAKCESNDEGDIKVQHILNSMSTPEGTLLHLATKLGQADTVRSLLSSGADPGVHNQEGKTALDLAQSQKVIDVFSQELLQATAQSNVGRVCQLIAAGVSVNLLDSGNSKNTPLHWAASYGNREIIQCLCKRNATVNFANIDGATPLHDAVFRDNLGVVEELMLAGADPKLMALKGKHAGKTPLDLASGKPHLTAVLKKPFKPVMNGASGDGSLSDLEISAKLTLSDAEQGSMSPLKIDPEVNVSLNGSYSPGDPQPELNGEGGHPFKFPKLTRQVSICPYVDKVTDNRLFFLWPTPKKIIQKDGIPFFVDSSMDNTLEIYVADGPDKDNIHKAMVLWRRYYEDFKDMNIHLHMEPLRGAMLSMHVPHVLCEVNKKLFSMPEGYRLSVDSKQVKLQAADLPGLNYGILTFLQLLKLAEQEGIPNVVISDWPDLRERGVLLDMSKGRILNLVSLSRLIANLAAIKINQIQIYARFQAKDPEAQDFIWQFPYPRSILMELDQICRENYIQLVPVLDVNPKVTHEELEGLSHQFYQFVTCFANTDSIGVGPRLTSLLVEISEDGNLQMSDVLRLIPAGFHHTIQLCAFVFHENVDVLPQFPFNMVLAEYGFQASYDFESKCKIFGEYGVPFSLMPGTSAWNSLAGCPEAAVRNIHNAVTSAIKHNSLGVTVSHWSGVCHLTHEPMSWPGLLTGAGLSWNKNIPPDYIHSSLADLMNRHILLDCAGVAGQVIIELGRAETYLLRCSRNQNGSDNTNLPPEKGTTLFELLTHPDKVVLDNLNQSTFQKTMKHIKKCLSELQKADLNIPDKEEILSELTMTADLMLSACRIGRSLTQAGKKPKQGTAGASMVNVGVANLSATTKTDLANRLLLQIENYRTVWLDRYLPTGLEESVSSVTVMMKQLVPEGFTTNKGDHIV